MNKQQLATKIWESANKMRSKIEASEYKDYILGFIFYKFLSEKELSYLKQNEWTDEEISLLSENNNEDVNDIRRSIGYFISYDNLFSTWLNMGNNFNISNVRDALSDFDRLINPLHKKVFNGIFDTLRTGLSKLGDNSSSQTKAVSGLLQLIKDIPMDGRQDYDVLGFIYEYLIGMFAANAGKKAGQFYTPHEVSLFMSEVVAHHLQGKKQIQIYDPTSGSGSLLINIGRSVAKHMKQTDGIKYYAQELIKNTYNLTRMNLVMRGILPDNIEVRNGDTLEEDWPYFDEKDPDRTYNPLYVDAVVSNPPYSQSWDPKNKENNPRFAGYGLAPKSKADYAFLLHDLYHVKPDGIMTIVLPHGVLFRGKDEAEIRRNLIENNNIDAIIGLPAHIFFGTTIPTIIMVLRKNKKNTDVLIVDASKGFIKSDKYNKLRPSDIKKLVDTVTNRLEIPKYSRIVSREEIRRNNYNLNIPRYVDSSEAPESWDLFASMFGGIPKAEIDSLNRYWTAFPSLKDSLFVQNSNGYYDIKSDNTKSEITEHNEIKKFKSDFASSFATLKDALRNRLIGNMFDLDVPQTENVLCDDIFERLKNIPLIDKYDAYQILADEWIKIAADLEVIQTEGFEAVRKVIPNYVVKKKNNQEIEIQDGWLGYILPFDLVQSVFLISRLQALKEKEDSLSNISSRYEEILDSMSEEEKNNPVVNDDNDKFVSAEIKKIAKQIKKETKITKPDDESFEAKVLEIAALMENEKKLKKEIKAETDSIRKETKEIMESLSSEDALKLLEAKWIVPLITALNKLPDEIIEQLTVKIRDLSEKYAVVFSEVEQEIKKTERDLSAMLEELTGNEYDMKGLEEFKLLLKGE